LPRTITVAPPASFNQERHSHNTPTLSRVHTCKKRTQPRVRRSQQTLCKCQQTQTCSEKSANGECRPPAIRRSHQTQMRVRESFQGARQRTNTGRYSASHKHATRTMRYEKHESGSDPKFNAGVMS
jgi:hypothetical protein